MSEQRILADLEQAKARAEEAYSYAEQNAMVRQSLSGVKSLAPLTHSGEDSGAAVAFPAKLGAYSSGYTWTEQVWDNGAWANLTGGRSGTTAEAFDDNEDVPADTIVAMIEVGALDSFGEPTDPVYRFVYQYTHEEDGAAVAFPAKIGAYSSGYTWTEQVWDNGAWDDLAGGRSGTTAEAFDGNEDVTSAYPYEKVVLMVEVPAFDSFGEPIAAVYRFVYQTTIPNGVNDGDMLVWTTTEGSFANPRWVRHAAPTDPGEYSLRLSKSSEIGGEVTFHWDLHEEFECPAEEEPPP